MLAGGAAQSHGYSREPWPRNASLFIILSMNTSRFGHIFLAAGAFLVTCGLAVPASTLYAYAADETQPIMYAATTFKSDTQQFEIETLSETYDNARARAAEASANAAATEVRVNELQAKMEARQESTDNAVRNIYVMEQSKYHLFDAMLDASSLDDFIKCTEYVERIGRVSTADLNEHKSLLADLEAEYAALEAERQEAASQEDIAYQALLNLQSQRAAKQAAAKATDGADWYMSKEDFIAEWAPRIDAYFVGTPMANTGAIFAEASWHYCIDPRWSPAISTIESSKGTYCIRPYNAWGWGAADSDPYNLASEWDSWESAINAHVKGLARGYGYTVTLAGAKAYCPPNWETWYKTVVSEMAKI